MTSPMTAKEEGMGKIRRMRRMTPMIPIPPICCPLSAEVLGNIKHTLSLSNGALL